MDYHPNSFHDTNPNVTVTILPVSLALVHIPRHRLRHFSHPLLKQILQPSPTFLNISCNATEVSIIAERETMEPFVKAAKKDTKRIERRMKRRLGMRSKNLKKELQPVEVSSTWSALQIDSHGDQIGDASARIREISALLSGISILYQSSYSTDFIFVQSARLPKVISILTSARFLPRSSSYAGLARNLSRSPGSSTSSSSMYSPISRDRSSSYPYADTDEFEEAETWADRSGRGRRSRRDTTTTTTSSIHSHGQSITSKLQLTGLDVPPPSQAPPPPPLLPAVVLGPVPERPYSFSPGKRPDIQVLPSDLVVVGLSDDSDAWATKLIRLLLFSEELVKATGPTKKVELVPKVERKGKELMIAEEIKDQDEGDDDDAESYHSLDEDDNNNEDDVESSSSDSDSSISSSVSSSSQPFFSLTRTSLSSSTSTSSSLTSDIHLLAALFPRNERHWIFCGDEFDRLGLEDRDEDSDDDEERDESDSGEKEVGGFLRCLHVDLQDFGLDRHGLVNRFSTLLHAENIHHLYSSTFKTANLLVHEQDAERALEVLRSC